MGMYCDSKVLENNWYNWLVSQATPDLETFRADGLLLTKVISRVEPRQGLTPDPFWGYPLEPRRAHCIAVASPVYFNSYSGRCGSPHRFHNGKLTACRLPPTFSILDKAIVDKMSRQGYIVERPVAQSWAAILLDVQKICNGIIKKFNLPSDEFRSDLESEAFVQVTNKIKLKKLVYTPGKAPVFNLLTTTIYRIIFSILNKETKDKRNRTKHANLVTMMASKGQSRLRGRIVTRRVYGSLIAGAYC